MTKTLVFLTAFFISCSGTAHLDDQSQIKESNNDVALLSLLIHDRLVHTNGRSFDLKEIIQQDSLSRITNQFKSLLVKSRAAHLAVYYQFTNTRNGMIALTEPEKQQLQYIKWKLKKVNHEYDGEIWFDYPERFSRVRRIIVTEK